jgi:hypothetical protein
MEEWNGWMDGAQGWVEEDVEEINHWMKQPRMKTTCSWASLYTAPTKLFPSPEKGEEREIRRRGWSTLEMLCEEFPELFSVRDA